MGIRGTVKNCLKNQDFFVTNDLPAYHKRMLVKMFLLVIFQDKKFEKLRNVIELWP